MNGKYVYTVLTKTKAPPSAIFDIAVYKEIYKYTCIQRNVIKKNNKRFLYTLLGYIFTYIKTK